MDSFDIMGQFDSMLPPGDIRRKLVDKSLMGLEMRGGGGGDDGGQKEAAKKQYKYDKRKYKYDNEQLERQRKFAIKQNEIKRDELAESVGRQNQMGQDNADRALEIHNFQFDRQMEAFQKSEQLHRSGVALLQKNRTQQLDYNRASFNLSKESIETQTFERYQKLAFKATEALMKHQQGTETGNLEYVQKLRGLEQKRTKAVMTHQAERAQGAQQGLVMQLQGAKAEGKVRARGVQGRSNEKQIQAAVAESGLKQSMLYDKITRSGFAFDAAIYGMETALRHTMADNSIRVKYSNLDYALKQKQLAATEMSIGKAYVQAQKGAEHKWRGADMQTRLKTDQGMRQLQAQRMLKPVAGPLPPKWTDLSVPTVLDPPEIEYGPEPIKGATMTGGSASMGTGGLVTTGLMGAASALAVGTGVTVTAGTAATATTAAIAPTMLIGPWAPVAVAALAIGSMFIDW